VKKKACKKERKAMKASVKERWTPFREKDFPPVPCFHEMWQNKTHTVLVGLRNKDANGRPTRDGWIHLSIRRNDRKAECDWRIFQRIKNDIAGDEREAVQLFPAMRRVLDTANQYHLWVAPKQFVIGIGQMNGEVSEIIVGKQVQRSFTADDPLRGLIGEPRDPNGTEAYYPLPMYPTILYSYLTSDGYREMPPHEQEAKLRQFFPYPPIPTPVSPVGG
jgi:hypothetical protein